MSITYSRHVKRPNVIPMVHHCRHYISRSIYWLNFFYHLSFRLFIWFVYLRLILSLWRHSTMFSGRCGVKEARNSHRLPLPHHSKLNEWNKNETISNEVRVWAPQQNEQICASIWNKFFFCYKFRPRIAFVPAAPVAGSIASRDHVICSKTRASPSTRQGEKKRKKFCQLLFTF